jgi:CBS-domain-containing membrane protein
MLKMIITQIKRAISVCQKFITQDIFIDIKEHLRAFVGSFIGIGIIAFLQSYILIKEENIFLIASFGASSVLIYGAANSPLAKPRNVIGGQFISAIIGVAIYKLIPDVIWIAAPLAVALSIVIMQITKTLHPPGGATALIAVIGTEKIKLLGYKFAFCPVLLGSLILLFVAFIFNKLSKNSY